MVQPLNSDFINWTKDFGTTLAPPTTYSPWTNGKVKISTKSGKKVNTSLDTDEVS